MAPDERICETLYKDGKVQITGSKPMDNMPPPTLAQILGGQIDKWIVSKNYSNFKDDKAVMQFMREKGDTSHLQCKKSMFKKLKETKEVKQVPYSTEKFRCPDTGTLDFSRAPNFDKTITLANLSRSLHVNK